MTDPALERLAHQVLWPGFAGTSAPDWLRRSIDAGTPGAVLFAHNVATGDPEQLRGLVAQLHAGPGLVGIDEEGGLVTRLHAEDGSPAPGHAVLGRADNIETTERVAGRIGRELSAVGVDLNLAPDADVNNNPANPVIGTRSFGADPELVARHTAAYVRGLQAAGVAACAKHFPGHGDTATDSHVGETRSEISRDELEQIHLAPFRAAVAAGVQAVLTAHIIVPPLGAEPATLNPRSIRILREELGFEGLIVSDAMDMDAIAAAWGIGPGTVAALNAGIDLACLGNHGSMPRGTASTSPDEAAYQEVHAAVIAALRDGTLSPDRLVEAATRIEAVRQWRSAVPAPEDAGSWTDPTLEVESALRACEVQGDVRLTQGSVTVIDGRRLRNRAAGRKADLVGNALAAHREVHRVAARDGLDGFLARPPEGPLVLVVDQPHVTDAEAEILARVLTHTPDAVVVRLGWPGELAVAPARMITTYGSSAVSALAAARAMLGETPRRQA